MSEERREIPPKWLKPRHAQVASGTIDTAQTFSLTPALIRWLLELSEKTGRSISQIGRDALFYYHIHCSDITTGEDRKLLCDRLRLIDDERKRLERHTTQTQIDELTKAYKDLGGTLDSINEIAPKLYSYEFHERIPVVVIGVFEQGLQLKREDRDLQERLKEPVREQAEKKKKAKNTNSN